MWSHVAAVYNGTTINLYLNGVSVLSTAIVNTDYDTPIYIGSVPAGNEYFNGHRIIKGIYHRDTKSQRIYKTTLLIPFLINETLKLMRSPNRLLDNFKYVNN